MFFNVNMNMDPEALERLRKMKEEKDETDTMTMHVDGAVCLNDTDLIKVVSVTDDPLPAEDAEKISAWVNGTWHKIKVA
jgi:hypothetical protein